MGKSCPRVNGARLFDRRLCCSCHNDKAFLLKVEPHFDIRKNKLPKNVVSIGAVVGTAYHVDSTVRLPSSILNNFDTHVNRQKVFLGTVKAV